MSGPGKHAISAGPELYKGETPDYQNRMGRTKIIATLGPATADKALIERLILLGVNLPVGQINLPAITEKDKADIQFGIAWNLDLIALSFVQSADDIRQAKELVRKEGGDTPVFAKIEKSSALENIEEIILEADGLMIARGDLGVEMGPYIIPVTQKRIIEEPFIVTISRHSTRTGTTNVVQLVDKQSIKELQDLAYKPGR